MTTIYGDGFIADRVPELPEPAHWEKATWAPDAPKVWVAYSADQMRSFYAAGVAAGMERAAVIVEQRIEGNEADPETYLVNQELRESAEAIRSAIRSQEG